MLTPVRAVSNTDVSFNSYTSPQQGGAASTMASGNSALGNSAPQENSSLGRASILALSGQLQLSQSVTVLAEALGRMLNIPRKDAESVDDYVNRLVQTIRGLSSSDREVLNQQLAKVLQGLTLKIIAEVLKNPAGPDAARLALLLEMTRYQGDLAAKAVVSSYRQNTGNDLLAALPARDQTSAPAQQGAQARPGLQGPPTQAEAVAAKTLATEPGQKGPVPSAALHAEESSDDAKVTGRQTPAVNSAQGATTQTKQDTAHQTAATKPGAATAGAATSMGERVAETDHAEAPARNAAVPTVVKGEKPVFESAGTREDRNVQRPHADGRAAEQPRNAEPGTRMDHKSMLTKSDLENLLLTSLAAQKLPQRAQGSSAYPAAISQMLESTQLDAAKPGFAANTGSSAASVSAEQEPPLPAARVASEGLQQGAVSTEAKAAFEQPLLQSALASLSKEGLGMPYVANPQAKDEPDSSSPHRGRWPSSSDDGGEGHQDAEAQDEQAQDGHADGEEQQPDKAEVAGDTEGSEPDAGNAESAQAYYLRMGGLA